VKSVTSPRAPAPVGPYSQAVAHEGLLFVSGQIALDPEGGMLVPGGIEAETLQVISNLRAILEEAGTSLRRVLRRVNDIYARHFTGDPPPARATVQVAALPLGAQVEIDAIAALAALGALGDVG
jgi:2-iminobutanoate/2-iminopropanoate deaminase